MGSTILSLALVLAAGASAQAPQAPCSRCNVRTPHRHGGLAQFFAPGGRIVQNGPGYGYGFPNGNPDGYGWWDYGTALPLGANRTSEYFFPRYLASPPEQMFLPNYYNPYIMRGQRYLNYAGCGGDHPAGGNPTGSAMTPMHPYQETLGNGPQVALPAFTGRVEAPPINSGGTGLTP